MEKIISRSAFCGNIAATRIINAAYRKEAAERHLLQKVFAGPHHLDRVSCGEEYDPEELAHRGMNASKLA